MEATPRPWTMEVHPTYVTIKFGQFDIVSGRYSGMGIEQDKADGEFIVKAANAHDRLIEALEEIQRMAETDPTNLPQKMFASQIAARCVVALAAACVEVK